MKKMTDDKTNKSMDSILKDISSYYDSTAPQIDLCKYCRFEQNSAECGAQKQDRLSPCYKEPPYTRSAGAA